MLSNLVSEIASNTCWGMTSHLTDAAFPQICCKHYGKKYGKKKNNLSNHACILIQLKRFDYSASGSTFLSSFSRPTLSAYQTINVEMMPEQLRLYNRRLLQKNSKSLHLTSFMTNKCVLSITKVNEPSSNGNRTFMFCFLH